jgi:hypothetical protein
MKHKTEISTAAAALGSLGGQSKSAAKTAAVRENGKLGGRPVMYRQFVSHGFLRVKRWDSERGEYVQIGSFAGPDAVKNAEERIAEDKQARAI